MTLDTHQAIVIASPAWGVAIQGSHARSRLLDCFATGSQ